MVIIRFVALFTVKFISQKAGKHTTVTYRSYKHFNVGAFLGDLSESPFGEIYGLADPEVAFAHFCKAFSSVYDKHVPRQKKRMEKKNCHS